MRTVLSAVGATSREGHRTELRKAISWLPRVGEPPKPVKFCFLDKHVGGTMCWRACPRGRCVAWNVCRPMALTLTSPDDQTFGSEVITLTNSAGPLERRFCPLSVVGQSHRTHRLESCCLLHCIVRRWPEAADCGAVTSRQILSVEQTCHGRGGAAESDPLRKSG